MRYPLAEGRRYLLVAFLLVLLIALTTGAARASTVQPPSSPSGQASGCQANGLFGEVAPDGNALVGVEYPNPETGTECILTDGMTLPGDLLEIWLYTPNQVVNNTVNLAIEEYRMGSRQLISPGPNGTEIRTTVPAQTDVVWSNATVSAAAGTFQQFGLQVPPVFVDPQDSENLTIAILGLQLQFQIATPGTALPVAETLGGLIGWLALMSPAAVVSFVSGFGPGQLIVHRLRYVSTGRYAAAFAGVVSLAIVVGIAVDFTGFLYWLGDVGILGLALLLLFPMFLWGAALWITIRGRKLRARLARSPIAQSKNGEPVAGLAPVWIYGGGDTGHPEELVEGFGVGGPRAAWNRLLGLRIRWHADKLTPNPRFIHYEWAKGRLDIEGEYASWPSPDGRQLDYQVQMPEKIWFPWRKVVRARYDPLPVDPNNGHTAEPPAEAAQRDPARWAHRGFFLGLRHGDATLAALGSPDHIGPDQYIRGVADARGFALESQRRGKALVLLNAQIPMLAEELSNQTNAVVDRLQSFPGSPEAIEGTRELSTRVLHGLFDPDEYMRRLEERGRTRVDYRPPGASKYRSSVTEVTAEATEALPPDMRGRTPKKGVNPG